MAPPKGPRSALDWGRRGEGPDAAIEITGVLALGSHLAIHLSQYCGWEQQTKRNRYQEDEGLDRPLPNKPVLSVEF